MKPILSLFRCLAYGCALSVASIGIAGGPIDDSPTLASASVVPPLPAQGRPLGLAAKALAPAEASKASARAIPADENGLVATVLPTAGALAAVLVAILGAKWGAQKLGLRLTSARRPSGVVEILARYPIAKGQQVMLIKIARRVLVVHQSSAGMRTLSELASAEEVADLMARIEAGDRATKDPRFEATLQSALQGDLRSAGRGARVPNAEDADAVETIDLTRTARRSSRDGVIPNTAAIRRGLFGGRLA